MDLKGSEYAVILAGGSGTRFWPKSRLTHPKQLCKIGSGDLTMIEKTIARIKDYIPSERIIIVTHKAQVEKTKEIVGDRCKHYLAEPEAKNTAAALIYAAKYIESLGSENAVMMSLHADHVIADEKGFVDCLKSAAIVAKDGYLTLLGIKPTSPETGYGYIEQGDSIGESQYKVSSFKEKPIRSVAESYLESGNYLWNSGYFIWSTSTFLGEVKKFLPDSLEKISKHFDEGKDLEALYSTLESIAVDNAILEKSDSVAVVGCEFGWDDVGSWDALSRCFGENGEYFQGEHFDLDCKGLTIDSDNHFIAAIGLEDVVIVHTKDATLVCKKDKSQDVKKVVEWLKEKSKTQLL